MSTAAASAVAAGLAVALLLARAGASGPRAGEPEAGAPAPSAVEAARAATPADAPTDDERAVRNLREGALLRRIAELEEQLSAERDRHLAREREWLEFTRAIASLDVPAPPAPPEFLARAIEVAEPEPDPATLAVLERERRRADAIRLDLRAHLMAEQVFGLDVLEVGVLHDGWIGPVVLRTHDERGRALGTLAAERLRLEASRSGHAIAIVLEEGYERIGGAKVPFGSPAEEGAERGGVRRIQLAGVDPAPWIESFPELFDADVLLGTPDDGAHDLLSLRLAIDALLRAESSAGRWRLRELGGVLEGELRGVQLVELDRSGSVLRRLFADRLRVRRAGGGVELVLRDGVQVRGGRKAPFLQGTYRVFLPYAGADGWKAAGVPGL